ncbi:hypothetical protein AHF37_11261 [Paragonimus kellicotti]|nr:hypothetical protein AHF37_11261 [Paragonimus kellicotti]
MFDRPVQKISLDSTTSGDYSVDSTPKLSITQSPSFIDHSTQVELDELLFAYRSQWNTDSEPDLFTQLKEEAELYNNLSISHSADFGRHPSTVTEDNNSNSLYSTASSSLPSNDSSASASPAASSNDSQISLIEDDNEPMDQTKNPRCHVDTTSRNMSHFEAIVKRDATGYGLRVCGNKPVSVHSVRQGGTAEEAGLQPGDQIIKVRFRVYVKIFSKFSCIETGQRTCFCKLIIRSIYGLNQKVGFRSSTCTPAVGNIQPTWTVKRSAWLPLLGGFCCVSSTSQLSRCSKSFL